MTIRIQDDLYENINGEWLEKAVIPEDRPTIGGFASLAVDVEEKLMADFKAFESGKNTTDIPYMDDAIKLYRKVLDTDARNTEGIKPVLPLLNKIKSVKDIDSFNASLKELVEKNVPMPVEFGVGEDMNDATRHCFVVKGLSTILPDTTYYGTDEGNRLLTVFKNMINKLLSFTDLTDEEKEEYLSDALTFDENLSKSVKSRVEWADYVKYNNPTAAEEVFNMLKPFDLKSLMKEYYDVLPETITVYDPKAIKEFEKYFNFKQYIHYAYISVLLSSAKYLSEEMKHIGTEYSRTLTGVDADPEITKEAYQLASNVYSEPVGIYYGLTYFGEEAKKDVTNMVKKIIEAYKTRVKNGFLEESTKEKAILKLSTITIKMGYPDKVRDIYSKMKVDKNNSYFEIMNKINKVRIEDELNKLYKPVDKNLWQMPGHLVNACYDPSRNDITFPAAILQKPFYSLDQSVSENLGGIGAVIAHEISHAFDNNGAHFDENGNMNNWWTDTDFAKFNEMTGKMIRQWDGIPYLDDKVNGELVVSENIADNGGMAVTLQIMHETKDADFKAYFINWARIWCQKAKKEYSLFLLKNDVHSPARLRANMQVKNFKEWYDAFDVKETDKMYLKPEERLIIW